MNRTKSIKDELRPSATDSYARLIISRSTLITMVANLSSRHGRLDPNVTARMEGVEPEDLPLRIADYAHTIWDLCRVICTEESLSREDLMEIAVMSSLMTSGGETTADTIYRAIRTLRACDRVIGEQAIREKSRTDQEAAESKKATFFKFAKDGTISLNGFLRPFFKPNAKTGDKRKAFREYLQKLGGDAWAKSQEPRHSQHGFTRNGALAHMHHFESFLKLRAKEINRTRGSKGGRPKKG